MFDTLIVYVKEFFEKVDSEKISRRQKSGKNFPGDKELLQYYCSSIINFLHA